MPLYRELLSFYNVICFAWNCISLLIDDVSTNIIGTIWIFNVSLGILLIERYFPEIKNENAKFLLYAIIGAGHILAIILMCMHNITLNLALCFTANIFGFLFSSVYFIFKEYNK